MSRPAPLRRRGGLAMLAVTGLLTGCQLGERPTLGPAPPATADAATDAVLERLDATADASFTAEYSIVTPTGDETSARVQQDGSGARTVTVGTVRYVVDGTTSQTCDTETDECRDGLDAQPISRYAIAPDFYGSSAAARLRRDAAIRVGPTEATTEPHAGVTATCVTVPIEDTASVFCALDGGPLASWRTTDVTIELTTYAPG